MSFQHPYRSHNCLQAGGLDEGVQVRLSGWVHRKRDHGNLLFFDLRDHYGLVQCVIGPEHQDFSLAESVRLESLVRVDGQIVMRSPDTVNPLLSTGKIEVRVQSLVIESEADPLPFPVNTDKECPEEIRLEYRFLDLRRSRLHDNIMLRSQIIASLRARMMAQGFTEFQTPILTASSPEGARDYLVPSRVHPGYFYALPQAPQLFKQLLMVSGFDKYFQIAPCFRDEDARSDRSPGEFYQLDFEMAFATQEDIFQVLEPVLHGVFEEFSPSQTILSPMPFPRISYKQALREYGTDKPDLRNPLKICDLTTLWEKKPPFEKAIAEGAVVRAIFVPNVSQKPRSFFEKLEKLSQKSGLSGLGYIIWSQGTPKGPLCKFLDADELSALRNPSYDGVFCLCAPENQAIAFSGKLRQELGSELGLIEKEAFRFCWVIDFPLFDWDLEEKKFIFSHNPFSMPQGGMEALLTQDPLDIKAYQYDIVCNGCELSSGAIRNHLPSLLLKAFEIVGYRPEQIQEKFAGLWRAFQFGAPPHGGAAPGIDRIVMLLANAQNLREVIAFPLNQQAQDLLMGAPAPVSRDRLKEYNLSLQGERAL